MSSLSHEVKHRLSQLQHCLPKLIPYDNVLLEIRLVIVGMIPLEFGSNFELMSDGCNFCKEFNFIDYAIA